MIRSTKGECLLVTKCAGNVGLRRHCDEGKVSVRSQSVGGLSSHILDSKGVSRCFLIILFAFWRKGRSSGGSALCSYTPYAQHKHGEENKNHDVNPGLFWESANSGKAPKL